MRGKYGERARLWGWGLKEVDGDEMEVLLVVWVEEGGTKAASGFFLRGEGGRNGGEGQKNGAKGRVVIRGIELSMMPQFPISYLVGRDGFPNMCYRLY